MKKKTLNKKVSIPPYQSYAGYFGALAIIATAIGLMFLRTHQILPMILEKNIFMIVVATFVIMLISEFFLKRRYNKKYKIKVVYSALHSSNLYILKSTLVRFAALYIPYVLFYLLLHNHDYFIKTTLFKPTLEMSEYILYLFVILGLPYIFFTLKYRGDSKYELGDYALLTIIAVKSLYKKWTNKRYSHTFHKNRRVKKVWLLYLVNLFFWTLMVRFLVQEFRGFESEYYIVNGDKFATQTWIEQYKHYYLYGFHLLFLIDVSIATIGYSLASRWLNNRTKSVDATLGGWMVALMCYPPFNSVSSQFISYQGLPTHQLITSDIGLLIIFVLLFLLYGIYVWATVALGFKFSNLTNRGVVSIGPYSVVRHPAYTAKNTAWWVDNTFVLTYIWAAVAMALWNVVYITRALTEERHLRKDKEYEEYCKKVQYRFIPKVI